MKKSNERVSGAGRAVARVLCIGSPHRLRRVTFALLLGIASSMSGQGMPPEARENIHLLFNRHDQVQRELKLTEDGYEAVTESTNRQVVAALQDHVQQMQERLDNGLAARRWDPAFAEYRAYYDEIDLEVEKTERGLKITAVGKTPEGVSVAQNHATVITEFANRGWKAHDQSHPAVLTSAGDDAAAGAQRGMGHQGRGRGKAGCGGGCQRGCGERCSDRTASDH